MTYRLLRPDEWAKLLPLFPDPSKIPHPAAATCAVAEAPDGTLKGALFMQIALHCEPLILDNPHVNFLRLHETLEGAFSARSGLSYYAFSDSPTVAGMTELTGMKKMTYTVWRKEL